MTAFELLEAMGGIEEKYLDERYDAKKERMKLIRTFTAAAASVVLISGIGIGIALTGWRTGSSADTAGDFENFGITETNAAAVTEDACEPEAGNTAAMDGADLPELKFQEVVGDWGSAGDYKFFGCVSAVDLSELTGNNPWTKECTLETLPVYYNYSMQDVGGVREKYFTKDEMTEIAQEIADKLGEEIISCRTTSATYPIGTFTASVIMNTASYKVVVTNEGQSWIESSTDLPAEPVDEQTALACYERFESIVKFESPDVEFVKSYSPSGKCYDYVYLWDANGDERDQIISYALGKVRVYVRNGVYGIDMPEIFSGYLNEFVGDYPIISWEEAEELLYAGKYLDLFTNVSEEEFGIPDTFDHVELMYRTTDRYVMPYYKFYVRIEEGDNCNFEGEKMWAIYYVPAVSSEYLDESTFWDGSFN